MKRALFSLIIFLSSIIIFADNPGVKLHFASGEQMIVYFEDEPMFTFEEDDIVINCKQTEIRFKFGDLLEYTFINQSHSSIDKHTINDAHLIFADDGICGSHFEPNSKLFVYSADGKLICSTTADVNGDINAKFTTRKGVTYIIKSLQINLKMTKR